MELPICINCGEPVKIATEYAIRGDGWWSNPFKHALTERFLCEKPFVNAPGETIPSGPTADCGLRVTVREVAPA